MKNYNRKIYITNELNEELKNRLAHIDNGIANDKLIPSNKTFDARYNRDVVKKIDRFINFLKTSEKDDIKNYFKRNEIKILDNGLIEYSPLNSFFRLIFLESKGIISGDEYKILYLLAKDENIDLSNYKSLKLIEYKHDYILTDKQKEIATYHGSNVVLGAAGTGKTDVAIYSYINNSPLENIKDFNIKDNVFITYSKKLADYVSYQMDILWNDYKNPINKNIYTTKEFMIDLLLKSNIKIDGYNIINNKYIKNNTKNDYLDNNIIDINDFNNWINNDASCLNKSYLIELKNIVNKYGIEYPYLFYRGIYKGKILNKVSDNEIDEYLIEELNIIPNEVSSLRDLFDNYLNDLDELPDYDSFSEWYKLANKRYNNVFKKIENNVIEMDNMYNLMLKYFDFANPLRETKRYIDYYSLFKREAILIEGYRGNIREDFKEELKILYEMSNAFQKYLENNNLYDDNDLAYLISINIDKITDNKVFKNIIIDEFQDMTERQIQMIVKLTYNENDNGYIHIFGDFEQSINPTFLQLENIETIYLINNIKDYEKQILSSSFRYSSAICKELEALREKGIKLFGLEDKKAYLPLKSNSSHDFEASGNLVTNFDIGSKMLEKISKAKSNIMFIVSDDNSKKELINNYKIDNDKIFTISESKGREEDFVIVYKLCSSKALEYENIFSNDLSYSRAERIFYNQLYVGITRCKINFLQIEDDKILGKNTLKSLSELINPLLEENVDLFLEELLSNKANYYFRARDSFKNLDFDGAIENLSFYSGQDFDDLRHTLDIINKHNINNDQIDELKLIANNYKNKRRFDLARVIYTILDNNDLLILLDFREGNNKNYSDIDIKRILNNNMDYLTNDDINCFKDYGYFDRKKAYLLDKINNVRGK